MGTPLAELLQVLHLLDAWSIVRRIEDYHFKATVPDGVEKVPFEPAETDQ